MILRIVRCWCSLRTIFITVPRTLVSYIRYRWKVTVSILVSCVPEFGEKWFCNHTSCAKIILMIKRKWNDSRIFLIKMVCGITIVGFGIYNVFLESLPKYGLIWLLLRVHKSFSFSLAKITPYPTLLNHSISFLSY